jgi:phosphate/phosphite/phosphonate ABC transporter binding protein
MAALTAALLVTVAGCREVTYPEVDVDLTAAAAAPAAASATARATLRVSVAAIQSPATTFEAYSRLFDRMEQLLGMEIHVVQRRTYHEVNELLAAGKLDVAFVCTGGYLDLERQAPGAVEVIAVPIVAGTPTFRSFFVVRADSSIASVNDLAGKRFAFTDELSLTGYTYPMHRLRALGLPAERFFAATVFTHGHERSLNAVARGVVDAAAVSDHVYLAMTRDPALAGQLRVIDISPPFGGPPVIVSSRLAPAVKDRLRRTLLGLADDPVAAAALRAIGTERFVAPPPGLYDDVKRFVWTEP